MQLTFALDNLGARRWRNGRKSKAALAVAVRGPSPRFALRGPNLLANSAWASDSGGMLARATRRHPVVARRFSLSNTPTGVLLLSGFALNAIVTLTNGGFMPVPGEAQHGVYEPLTSETKLPWLADVRPLKSSIGDWLIGAGLVGLAGESL